MTADPARALLDQLDAAQQAATPGPWHVMRSNDERRAYAITAGRIVTDSAGCSVADAAAIVAEHNALPALTSALRQLADLADEWEGWRDNARRYGAAHPEQADIALARELAYQRAIEGVRAALSPLAAPDSSRSAER